MSEINVNGQVIHSEESFAGAQHRGLKYGDGLFESIRMIDGKMPLLVAHLRRLFKGMDSLKIEKPQHFNTAFFRKEIQRITGSQKDTRIRLSVFRVSGGLYTPTTNKATYLIEYQPFNTSNPALKKQGLMMKICPTVQLPITPWSGLKTTNALPYILAGLWKKAAGVDDCILLNQDGFVAEASSSNIFYWKNNQLITPSDKSGAILGVMREQVLKLAKKKGIIIVKKDVSPDELLKADEVFLTNAVQGIRWVRALEGVRFEETIDTLQLGKFFNS